MKDPKAANEQVITGILLASQFDLEGRITGLALYADTEDIYEVIQKPLDRSLLDCLQMKIRVHGEIQQLLDGHSGIKIRSIELVPDENNNKFFPKTVNSRRMKNED